MATKNAQSWPAPSRGSPPAAPAAPRASGEPRPCASRSSAGAAGSGLGPSRAAWRKRARPAAVEARRYTTRVNAMTPCPARTAELKPGNGTVGEQACSGQGTHCEQAVDLCVVPVRRLVQLVGSTLRGGPGGAARSRTKCGGMRAGDDGAAQVARSRRGQRRDRSGSSKRRALGIHILGAGAGPVRPRGLPTWFAGASTPWPPLAPAQTPGLGPRFIALAPAPPLPECDC